MKKRILLQTLVLVVVFLITSFSPHSIAQAPSNEIRIECEVVAGPGVIIYAPPDYTTPLILWRFAGAQRGLYYEVTLMVANTADSITTREAVIEPTDPPWAIVGCRPETFVLLPGGSTFVNVSIFIRPDAPLALNDFMIRFEPVE